MPWTALLAALPRALWVPMALAALLPVAVLLWRSRGTSEAVARRLASLVALQGSVGAAILVAATALVVFYAGLSQLATPTPEDLARTAADIERVRSTTAGDAPSLRARLALITSRDARVAWALLTRLPLCTARECLVANDPRLADAAALRLVRHAAARDADGAWPVRESGQVAMVVSAPLRDARGDPDALLLIGLDATPVVRQAAAAAWAVLGFTVLLGGLLVAGTRRAITETVSDRLRGLRDALEVSPVDQPTPRPGDADELKALAQAVAVAAARTLQQETQFRTLVEHAPVGIARLDGGGAVTAANPRFLALMGVGTVDTVPDWPRVFLHDEERAQFLLAVGGSGAAEGARWRWRDVTGRAHVVRASVVPLPEAADTRGAVLLVEDVSTQSALEAQLLRAQKMEVVGRLAGGIAHDFNNLLTVIRANVSVLGGGAASAELGAVDDAAARGARLVRRLLTISRADTLTLAPQPLGPLLHETVAMTRRVLPARLRIEAPTEVPAVTLRLDRDAIEQALLNLVLNARDAIPGEGTIRLTVETTDDGPRAGIAISCTDDGPGMPPDVLARATEPFFTTKGSDAGTGLGLSVVYSIMERHGGRLDLASAPGEGTRATLWFPLPTGEAMPAQVDRSAPVPAASAHGSAPRILLVEDEHPVRVATERALQRFGWRVASVSSAAEAERILAGDAVVDLVVSDIMMPGGTGIDLLRAVRATGCTVPFLFVSGYQVDSLEGVLDADERAALLPKPWSAAELREKVAGMLTPPGGRPAVRGPAAPAR